MPQSRSRIYLVLVKAFLASRDDLRVLRSVFERSYPYKTNVSQGSPTTTEVRDYVNAVLDALGAIPKNPPRSEDIPGICIFLADHVFSKKNTKKRSRTVQDYF